MLPTETGNRPRTYHAERAACVDGSSWVRGWPRLLGAREASEAILPTCGLRCFARTESVSRQSRSQWACSVGGALSMTYPRELLPLLIVKIHQAPSFPALIVK